MSAPLGWFPSGPHTVKRDDEWWETLKSLPEKDLILQIVDFEHRFRLRKPNNWTIAQSLLRIQSGELNPDMNNGKICRKTAMILFSLQKEGRVIKELSEGRYPHWIPIT